MKLSGGTSVVVGLAILWGQAATGQTDDEFKEWLGKEQTAFQQFQEERDREFVAFLQKEWKEYRSLQGIHQDTIPKPHVMPVAPVQVPAPKAPPEKIVEEAPIPEVPSPPPPVQPPVPPPETPPSETITEEVPPPPPVEKSRKAAFTFFGMPFTVEYDSSLVPPSVHPVNKAAIGASWEVLSRADYPALLAQARHYREQLQLNDWGYYQLLSRMAVAICQGGQGQCKLLVWFMLSKSGFEVKIGYDEEKVYLLLATGNPLYDVPYFSLGGERFYAVSAEGKAETAENLFTYDGQYPGADLTLDVRLAGPPLLEGVAIERKLNFQYGGKDQQIAVRLNRPMLDYLDVYPHTEYEVYFSATPSSDVERALMNSLKPMVAGKTEREAVNILLCFVQTAFGYQTDDEQFGREKPLFVEETLFYPASDCEDRAVLFAYLVRHLLELKVIGLDYPGHIATAVRFGGEMGGDYVVYENQHYTVCDPTYINAEVGMTIPQFSGVTPGVIHVGVQ